MLRRNDEFDAVVQRATLVACLLIVHMTIRPSGDDVQTMIVITNGSPETFASLKLDVFADASAVEPTHTDEVAGLRPTSDWRVSVSFDAQAWRLAYIDVGGHTWELSDENPIMPKMLSLHDPRFRDRRVG